MEVTVSPLFIHLFKCCNRWMTLAMHHYSPLNSSRGRHCVWTSSWVGHSLRRITRYANVIPFKTSARMQTVMLNKQIWVTRKLPSSFTWIWPGDLNHQANDNLNKDKGTVTDETNFVSVLFSEHILCDQGLTVLQTACLSTGTTFLRSR